MDVEIRGVPEDRTAKSYHCHIYDTQEPYLHCVEMGEICEETLNVNLDVDVDLDLNVDDND